MQGMLTFAIKEVIRIVLGTIWDVIQEQVKAKQRAKEIKNAVKDKDKARGARRINDVFRSI